MISRCERVGFRVRFVARRLVEGLFFEIVDMASSAGLQFSGYPDLSFVEAKPYSNYV